MALCDSDDVAVRLGGVTFSTAEATLVGDLITAAQAHIEREAGRALEAGIRSELFDPPDNPNVWLTFTPVDTSTSFSVTVDGTPLSADQYSVDPESGRLTRVVNGRARAWSTYKLQSITVGYVGGYQTIPGDLKDICARAAARAYQAGVASAATPSAGVRQINLSGSDSVTFVDEANDVTAAAILTDDEIEVARYYRNQVLA